MDIRTELRASGLQIDTIEPMGGGCISEIYHVRLKGGGSIVAKVDEGGNSSLPVEAFMLTYLTEHSQLPVPAVIQVTDRLLLLEYLLGESFFNPEAERHAAVLLAGLHSITSDTSGFHQDTLIGGLRQPNSPTRSWIDFFREQRLLYMAQEAMKAGRLPAILLRRVENLCDRLENYLFEPAQPSLIHGDVWTTNILASGGRITGFLDPAIYFAHDEIELAFTTLFHTFGPDFFDEYQQHRPLAPGFFEERRDIYNLYPLLVHVRLFGGSYLSSVEHLLSGFGY